LSRMMLLFPFVSALLNSNFMMQEKAYIAS